VSAEPSQLPSAAVARKRVQGRRFAVVFALVLVGGTAVFTYLARQAQRSRAAAFERMQHDGIIEPE
jgi:hypothetical protein